MRVTFYEGEREEPLGSFTLGDRGLEVEGDKEALKIIFHNLAKDERGRPVTPQKDPEGWLRALPGIYKSAYLSCELEE